MSSISSANKRSPKRGGKTRRSRPSTPNEKKFDPNSWKARVYKKDKRGRWYLDNTRLVYEAQRMACNPDATEEEISQCLAELAQQITKGESFRKDAASRTERLTDERKVMREEVQRLNKKKESVRREYLRIHNQNERKTRVQKVESIGDDLDYDVAFQCLKLEVEQLTNDVDFLKAAFGEEEDDEEYIFAGEEEETNDANKESNKDDATGYDLYDQAINKDNDENEEQNTLNDPEKQPEIKNSKIFMFSKDEDPAEEEAEYEEIIEEEEEEEEEEANDLIDEEVDDE